MELSKKRRPPQLVDIVTEYGHPAKGEAFEAGREALRAAISLSCTRPEKVVVVFDEATDEWLCDCVYKPGAIRRLRRITGYCSDSANFNAAKMAELRDRKKHMKITHAGE